jgi:hypothetical protein
MTKALVIRTDTALTADHDPIERWDAAVSRYLETRKGGPKGKTAKTCGLTPFTPEVVKPIREWCWHISSKLFLENQRALTSVWV